MYIIISSLVTSLNSQNMAASPKSIQNIVTCFLGVFFLIDSSSAETAPYTSFAKKATSAPSRGYYDYIIIGGGTAGCPLAATLSASAKVLLLERGGLPYDNPNVVHATGFLRLLTDPSPDSAAQLFISNDGVFNHRARVLGGGSAVNAGFYTRASSDYVNRVGWAPRRVKASYEWVERKVAFPPKLRKWQAAVRDGLLDAGVLPDNGFTYEHLHGTKIGSTIFDQNGIRHTAADLLEYAHPNNITVYFHATVHQILFTTSPGKRRKAYGALFKDSEGNVHMAYLNKGSRNEIIVSAGALGSPQLLMLSGIGPGPKLKAHGIQVVLDQPMVGQGMSDNPFNGFVIPSRKHVEPSLVQVVGITDIGFFIEAVNGQFDPSSLFTSATTQTKSHGLIMGKVAGPFSRGYMELDSRNPNDSPSVTFNYFNDSRDLHKCVQGMEILKRVVKSQPISQFRYPNSTIQSLLKYTLSVPLNLRTRHKSAAYNMEQYCKDTVATIWHYHGGCQVNRVVDRHYRVLGVDALRVVDGSTFSYSPGTNPQATVMMLGRYMGRIILKQRHRKK
ncbi:protein HOTHEAD-like [Salvia miltiorrhiza]|uniref:protein HOTHEAD-like n=1 Tax=Salvia miltiorrhiza TaxID=226208 RepID=UPI0025AD2B81|nr:protein HOTHEAD-like [Salvia miltiorrhiza]